MTRALRCYIAPFWKNNIHYCNADAHANFLCTLLFTCCGRKLKEYKNRQPLIRMPEPLPENGVLANHSLGKFERNDRKKDRKNERMKDRGSGFLLLDGLGY